MGFLLLLRPLSALLFRSPGTVYEAGVHGPAAAAASLSYPAPSTVAGLLAGLAYRWGLCRPDPGRPGGYGDFEDHEECIASLLGEDYYVRPGLVAVERGGGVELYAYTGARRLPRLDALLEGGGGGGALEALAVKARGIALDRRSKSVLEGMLYTAEYVEYPGGGAVAVLAGPALPASVKRELDGAVAPFGGDARAARLAVLDGGEWEPARLLVTGEGPEWEATLLTPALIEYGVDDEPRVGGDGRVVFADEGLARELADALKRQSSPAASACIEDIEVLEVPRNEYQLEVLAPGWSKARRAPRDPHLLVPPGTRLRLRAPRECAETLARAGLGAHSRLGWGTLLLHRPRKDEEEDCRKANPRA